MGRIKDFNALSEDEQLKVCVNVLECLDPNSYEANDRIYMNVIQTFDIEHHRSTYSKAAINTSISVLKIMECISGSGFKGSMVEYKNHLEERLEEVKKLFLEEIDYSDQSPECLIETNEAYSDDDDIDDCYVDFQINQKIVKESNRAVIDKIIKMLKHRFTYLTNTIFTEDRETLQLTMRIQEQYKKLSDDQKSDFIKSLGIK